MVDFRFQNYANFGTNGTQIACLADRSSGQLSPPQPVFPWMKMNGWFFLMLQI